MQTLIIHEELKNLLPPLSDEEYTGLEESILKDGCLSPFIVWHDILVDGHYRYEICKKHAIPFSVQKIVFENLDDVKLWIWKHQGCRRNMTPFQRAESVLKLKDIVATKLKKRRSKRNDSKKLGHETESEEVCQEFDHSVEVFPVTAKRYWKPDIVLDDAYGAIRIRKGTPPESFAAWFAENFSVTYLRHFTNTLIGELRSRYGSNFRY